MHACIILTSCPFFHIIASHSLVFFSLQLVSFIYIYIECFYYVALSLLLPSSFYPSHRTTTYPSPPPKPGSLLLICSSHSCHNSALVDLNNYPYDSLFFPCKEDNFLFLFFFSLTSQYSLFSFLKKAVFFLFLFSSFAFALRI